MNKLKTAYDNQSAFWALAPQPREGCWEWQGPMDGHGYGRLGARVGRALGYNPETKAHRFSWELRFGEIPAGKFICHHCDNPPCVRPSHLFLGDAKANAVDRDCKARGPQSAKVFCLRGHLLSGKNLRIDKRGHRICRACDRERHQPRSGR